MARNDVLRIGLADKKEVHLESKPINPWGCYNRPPRVTSVQVQDGWHSDGDIHGPSGKLIVVNGAYVQSQSRRIIWIDTPWDDRCMYDLRMKDPRCLSCKHQNS